MTYQHLSLEVNCSCQRDSFVRDMKSAGIVFIRLPDKAGKKKWI